jgi:APA family basic amino acid/polyamine antiporter
VIYTEWIFFALMVGGLFILRRRTDYAPSYRIWGYPIVPAIFVITSLTIVAFQLADQPVNSGIGLALVLIGWPVYRQWVRK